MKINEFMQQIETTYSKHFPLSRISVDYVGNIYRSISIVCYLAGNNTEVYNKIWRNDMLNIRFSIDAESGEFEKGTTIESEIPEKLKMEVNCKNYLIKPNNSHLVYSRRELTFRKTKGNAKKIVATLDKYFTKLKEELKNDLLAGNITDNHKELLTKKLV